MVVKLLRSLLCSVLFSTLPLSALAGELANALRLQGQTCPSRDLDFPHELSFGVFETNGLHILVVAGGIDTGDADRLRSYLRQAGPIDEVWLDSPGGIASEGPEIGKVLRAARLAVRVPAGFECISSCTLAFLGGIVRRVDPGGAYGVHTFFSSGSYRQVLKILSTDYSQNLSATQRQKMTKKQLSDYSISESYRKLRQFLHDSEQSDALLATKWQIYTQQMGISRDFLLKEVISQKSISLTSDAEVAELKAQGLSDEKIAKMLQTYHCPAREILRKYNVVNVD
jgi:hypothetical protein